MIRHVGLVLGLAVAGWWLVEQCLELYAHDREKRTR